MTRILRVLVAFAVGATLVLAFGTAAGMGAKGPTCPSGYTLIPAGPESMVGAFDANGDQLVCSNGTNIVDDKIHGPKK